FDCAAIANTVEVSDGQQIHAVEPRCEKQSGENQTEAGSEGIGHHTPKPFLHESRGNAEHGLGAEPRGEDRRSHHRQRQTPTGHREILRILHTRGRVETDPDGTEQIERDKPE
ncbi:MAG: hypothetical protein QG615_1384, partial [Nitrospirota bacterium]|nr:hypothetical protein [Nitrospirota bacterium]